MAPEHGKGYAPPFMPVTHSETAVDAASTVRPMKAWFDRHPKVAVRFMSGLVVVLVVVAVVQGMMLLSAGWTVPLGDLAEWVGATGALATVGALVIAWKVYESDKRARTAEDTRREASEQRRQAELITGWFIHYGSAKFAQPIPDGTSPGTEWVSAPKVVVNHAEIGLINASQVVIYDVIVAATCKPSPTPLPVHNGTDYVISEAIEWNEERDRLARGRANVLPPGWSKVGLRLATASLRPEQLHLFFRDHQGTYWWRDHIGKLTKMTKPVDSDPKARNRQIAEALGVATDGRVGILMVRPLEENRAT